MAMSMSILCFCCFEFEPMVLSFTMCSCLVFISNWYCCQTVSRLHLLHAILTSDNQFLAVQLIAPCACQPWRIYICNMVICVATPWCHCIVFGRTVRVCIRLCTSAMLFYCLTSDMVDFELKLCMIWHCVIIDVDPLHSRRLVFQLTSVNLSRALWK